MAQGQEQLKTAEERVIVLQTEVNTARKEYYEEVEKSQLYQKELDTLKKVSVDVSSKKEGKLQILLCEI